MSLYFVYLFILPNISNPHTPTLERTNHNDWTRTNVTPMCGHNRHWKRKLDRTHSEAGRQKVIAGSGHKKCFPKMHCGWDGITNVSLSARFSGKPPTRLLLKPDFKKKLAHVHSPRAAVNRRVGVIKKENNSMQISEEMVSQLSILHSTGNS